MRAKNIIFILFATFALTSCAAMFAGTAKKINIRAVDTDGDIIDDTSCQVIGDRSQELAYHLQENPGSVYVEGTRDIIEIHCIAEGYEESVRRYAPGIEPTTLGNLIFFPGYVMDATSGAINSLPDEVIMVMFKNGEEPALQIIEEVTEEEEEEIDAIEDAEDAKYNEENKNEFMNEIQDSWKRTQDFDKKATKDKDVIDGPSMVE